MESLESIVERLLIQYKELKDLEDIEIEHRIRKKETEENIKRILGELSDLQESH